MKNIRNFSIIAHIDPGKSTLADRLIQECGAVSDREMSSQIMDTMDIEKERGITIKAQSVRLNYALNGQNFVLNLIDTPGHVNFSYEVSRSLASCEGALLVVDASQGVEAQTIANVYIALENNLEIIPVINKINLIAADPARVKDEIEHIIGLDCSGAIEVSAKTGVGIKELLEAIITRIPAPNGDTSKPTKALIYDSWFDNYLGALALVRIYDGEISKNDEILVMGTGKKHIVLDLMYPNPIAPIKTKTLSAGEVGIVVLGLKNVSDVQVGDTITHSRNPLKEPKDINLLEIFNTVNDKDKLFKIHSDSPKACPLGGRIEELLSGAQTALENELKNVTLQDLLDELAQSVVELENVNLFIDEDKFECETKIRYRSPKLEAFAEVDKANKTAKLTLNQNALGVAQGQLCVMYDGDRVIASGFIKN